jgi:hypothetical protein
MYSKTGNNVLIFNSLDAREGRSAANAAKFSTSLRPTFVGLSSLVPISFDARMFINNCNARNNSFVINGVAASIPVGHYTSTAALIAALTGAMNAATGLIFTITNISTFGGSRLRVAATGLYTITASNQFNRLTGITTTTVPALTNDFENFNPTASDFIDICSPQISTQIPDFNSSNSSSAVLFRVTYGHLTMALNYQSIETQSDTKKLMLTDVGRIEPYIEWRVVDEFGSLVEFEPGSRWWITLAANFDEDIKTPVKRS